MAIGVSSDGQELASILDQLARTIAGLGEGMRRSDGSIDSWSDIHREYLDAQTPGLGDERLDLCLHDGRLFVVRERH